MTNQDAERNLKDWIRLHRLPDSFPVLAEDDPRDPDTRALADETYLRDDGREIRAILDRIQGSPRTIVTFGAGQGTTTIQRQMIRMAYEGTIRSMSLFVVIDPVADLEDPEADDPSQLFSRAMIAGMLKLLIEGRWEHRLYAERQAHLLATFGVADETELDDLRIRIEDSGVAAPEFQALIDRYVEEPGRFVDGVHRKMNISTVLIFDVPSQASEDTILTMVRAVKWFDQVHRPIDMSSAAFSEVYLITRDHAELMYTAWQRDYQEIDFRRYSVAEVFAILATRFHPKLGRDAIHLNAILDQGFVRQAWSEELSLIDVTKRLRRLMLERLAVDRNQVEYALKPSAL